MAIKIGGTTVVNDSRQLQNIASLDATTTATIGAAAGGGSITATASGAIAAGDPVVLNTNGTVSTVSGSAVYEDIGDAVDVFTGNSQKSLANINDPANNKVVVFYRNTSAYGACRVGTVSGTSISFGSEVVFSGTDGPFEAYVSYDENASKIVVIWRAGSPYYLKGRVGTVSGTSISWGSTYTLNADESTNMGIAYIGSGKHVVVYTDNFTDTRAHVITVSGTAISSGTQVQVSSSYANSQVGIGWDSNASKGLMFSRDGTTGAGFPFSVSGTTLTIGTRNQYSTNSIYWPNIVYNPDIQRLCVVFSDGDYGNYGRVMTATLSGSTVTFGTPFTFLSRNTSGVGNFGVAYHSDADKLAICVQNGDFGNAGSYQLISFAGTDPVSSTEPSIFEAGSSAFPWVAYDDNAQRLVFSTKDSNDSGKIKAIVVQAPYASSNLNNSNFLGFSNGAYSNAATATIDIVGALNTNQSGLTIGERYYVQVTGSLNTSADPFAPDALGGLATAATKLIVKG